MKFIFPSLPRLGAIVLLLFLGAGSANARTELPLPVSVAEAERVEAPRLQEIPGVIRPAVRATLAPKVMGVITEMSLELGQEVQRGETLARIAAPEIGARLEQARIAERQAARDLARETELLARQAATAESVRDLEDRLQLAKARLTEAEVMLSYTEIQAPFHATVTRKMADEGDLASPGQPLLELERHGTLQLSANVPDSLAPQLARGQEHTVLFGGNSYRARLTEISASADPRARTVETRFALPPEMPARSGSFARLQLPVETVSRILIPVSALTPLGQVERVFVVSDGVARMRLVRTGAVTGQRIEIQAGLEAGETVILNPPAGLRSGTVVAPSISHE